MADLYRLPFCLSPFQKLKRKFKKENTEIARPYMKRVYLSLDFLVDLNIDVEKLEIKSFYKSTSLAPFILANGTQINGYLVLFESEYNDAWNLSLGRKPAPKPINSICMGYRHFDKWKFYNGQEIGVLWSKDQKDIVNDIKLQRMIQRQVLGFVRYWFLRLQGKI